MPRNLTDTYIRALPPAAPGTRYAESDALVPGLRVRVTDKGTKSFILWRRTDPRRKSASALALGPVGVLTLAEARAKARSWLAQIANGQDPRHAERDNRDNTFAAVLEYYLTTHVRQQRKFKDVQREMHKELLPRFGPRPLTAIARRDVIRMIDELKARGAPAQARNCFGHMRTFCNWAIEKELLTTSPCDHIRLTRLLGPKLPRQRVLSDEEIFRLWAATEEIGYPYGALVQMLLLTGQRKNECALARYREFDLTNKVWTIPPERFKSNAAHIVPLSDAVLALLARLPRWAQSDFVFTSNGRKAFTAFSKGKLALDSAMGGPAPWCLHDLRRTMRTRLSALRVPAPIAELVIGHAKRGLERVYDLHEFADEMRQAHAAWGMRLQSIIAPPPANVVPLGVNTPKVS